MTPLKFEYDFYIFWFRFHLTCFSDIFFCVNFILIYLYTVAFIIFIYQNQKTIIISFTLVLVLEKYSN